MIKGLYPCRFVLVSLAVILVAFVGCGPGEGAPSQGANSKKSPPEPAEAPPLDKKPTGEVVEVGDSPEGVAADPETGLVAVGLRNPDELALVDGESGEVVKKVELPESPRHLEIAGPGGPVLVPAEGADSLVQVALPDGRIVSETPVGDSHTAPPRLRTAGSSWSTMGNTASVIEDGRELEKMRPRSSQAASR